VRIFGYPACFLEVNWSTREDRSGSTAGVGTPFGAGLQDPRQQTVSLRRRKCPPSGGTPRANAIAVLRLNTCWTV